MKKVFAIGLLALLLAGCASSGNRTLQKENQLTVQSKIQKGVTTKQQVKKQFGDPMSVSFTDGVNETWTYSLANVKLNGSTFIPFYGLFHNGSKAHVKQLVILFKNDIVEKYTMSETNTETKSGLAD